MQLLPLVEMYCKWELEEDCSNLRALMLRFDSERELESHELGRSLLCMLQDDDIGLDMLQSRMPVADMHNPFDVLRDRLAVAGLAIRHLHGKVHILMHFTPASGVAMYFSI